MWICYFDLDYSIRVAELNKKRKEGEEPLTSYDFNVGFYKPDGAFEEWDSFERRREAEEMVHYLNGGCIKRCEQ
jgi:hypothetical protein